jgi:hypothetical protein
VHSHRVKILNRADYDDVIRQIAHHFQLEFFPTQNRFLDQNFVNRRRREPSAYDVFKFLWIVGSAAASASQCERRSDDGGVTRRRYDCLRFVPRFGEATARHFEPGFIHSLFEQQAIFSNFDRMAIRANHFNPILLEYTGIRQRNCQIERGLSANRRQQGIGPFTFDDCG